MKKDNSKGGSESSLQSGLSEKVGFDANAQGSKVGDAQIPEKRKGEKAGKFTIK